jgi:5-methylcytosine-specific restriction endonuclease McrA
MNTLYKEQLSLPQWRTKRSEILKRDFYKCRACGNTSSLHVHHRQYHTEKKTGNYFPPWKYDNNYLITLCEKCHRVGHEFYKVPTFLK